VERGGQRGGLLLPDAPLARPAESERALARYRSRKHMVASRCGANEEAADEQHASLGARHAHTEEIRRIFASTRTSRSPIRVLALAVVEAGEAEARNTTARFRRLFGGATVDLSRVGAFGLGPRHGFTRREKSWALLLRPRTPEERAAIEIAALSGYHRTSSSDATWPGAEQNYPMFPHTRGGGITPQPSPSHPPPTPHPPGVPTLPPEPSTMALTPRASHLPSKTPNIPNLSITTTPQIKHPPTPPAPITPHPPPATTSTPNHNPTRQPPPPPPFTP
jgi:hypothetical protein